jgi:hypothetical protein
MKGPFASAISFLLGFIFTTQCCLGQTLPTHLELINCGPSSDNIAAQIGATTIDVLDCDLGDLNGDGIDEFVAAVETPFIIEDARERLVTIFQKQQGKWILWKSSSAPILNSEECGFFDHFEVIEIYDQGLHLSHNGGSNWRWWMNDTYHYDSLDLALSKHQSYWRSLCDEKVEWEINLTEGIASCVYNRKECPEGFGKNAHLDSLPKSEIFEISGKHRNTLEKRNDTTT